MLRACILWCIPGLTGGCRNHAFKLLRLAGEIVLMVTRHVARRQSLRRRARLPSRRLARPELRRLALRARAFVRRGDLGLNPQSRDPFPQSK